MESFTLNNMRNPRVTPLQVKLLTCFLVFFGLTLVRNEFHLGDDYTNAVQLKYGLEVFHSHHVLSVVW